MNRVILSGRLARELELKNVPTRNGETFAVINNALAVYKSQEETDFFDISFTGANAERAARFLKKGSRIVIEGKIHARKYTDKDGVKRTIVEISVDTWEFAESNGNTSNETGNTAAHTTPSFMDESFADSFN